MAGQLRQIRSGTVENLVGALLAHARWPDAATPRALAIELEECVHRQCAGLESRAERRNAYAVKQHTLRHFLGHQAGTYPDDIPAQMLADGRHEPSSLVEAASGWVESQPEPREVIIRMLLRFILPAAMEADPAQGRVRALSLVKALEGGAYNAVVSTCKASEVPQRRNWDSEQFKALYSERCGVLACLLDPESSQTRKYGATLGPRLLSGECDARAAGAMSARDLCPEASAAERRDIALRLEQRIDEKESNLFGCPYCGVRRCKYKEVQRRSLDEPPDYDCRCLACGRGFRGRS